jgi:hypothetical protein
MSIDSTRKSISKAANALGSIETPYGRVLQPLKIGELQSVYANPMALMHALTHAAAGFARLMAGLPTSELTIVAYIDECTPGNVLRHDKARSTQCVYWTFADLPDWFLVRQDSWFAHSTIRSAIAGELDAGVSELMKAVINSFWPRTGPSFAKGCLISDGNGGYKVITAKFGGLLGDEKGIKEVLASKGPGGTRPCLSCRNVVQFLDTPPGGYLQSISCTDRTKLDPSNDDEVYAAVDKIATASAVDRKRLEQVLGINHAPTGVLMDPVCREHVKPVTGWLRDWMHIFCVSGCASIEIQQLLSALRSTGIRLTNISEFCAAFTVPKSMPKVHPDWFTPKRMGRPSEDVDGWKGFSSEVLQVVGLLMSFLDVVVRPTGVMSRNIECFSLMHKLVSICASGPTAAAQRADEIDATIDRHGVIFVELYGHAVKPKFHHLRHLTDHARKLGKLLSCFVTERKHRTVKGPAAHIFGNYEKSMMVELLARNFEVVARESYTSKEWLEHAKTLFEGDGVSCKTSTVARLVCGLVHKGDLLMTHDGELGELITCCSVGDAMYLHIGSRPRRGARLTFSATNTHSQLVRSSDVAGPVSWAPFDGGILVVPPHAVASRLV